MRGQSLPWRSNFHSWKFGLRDSTALFACKGLMWRCAVMTRPCDTEVRQPKERRKYGVLTQGLEQTAGVAQLVERQALCRRYAKTMSRPALALIRRRLGMTEAVGCLPQWSQCSVCPHIGVRGGRITFSSTRLDRVNQGAQGVVSALRQVELTRRQKGMEAKPGQRANWGCRRSRQGVCRRLVKTVSRPPLALRRRLFGL